MQHLQNKSTSTWRGEGFLVLLFQSQYREFPTDSGTICGLTVWGPCFQTAYLFKIPQRLGLCCGALIKGSWEAALDKGCLQATQNFGLHLHHGASHIQVLGAGRLQQRTRVEEAQDLWLDLASLLRGINKGWGAARREVHSDHGDLCVTAKLHHNTRQNPRALALESQEIRSAFSCKFLSHAVYLKRKVLSGQGRGYTGVGSRVGMAGHLPTKSPLNLLP